MSCFTKLFNNTDCVPTYKVQEILLDTTANTAILVISSCLELCAGQNFKLTLTACQAELCSGARVFVQDSTQIYNVYNRRANFALLGQVAEQATRHGCLHMTVSTDVNLAILWQDIVSCSKTPVISYTLAKTTTTKTTTKA